MLLWQISRCTNLDILLEKCVNEVVQKVIGIVDPVRELSDDPDDGRLGFGLVQKIHVLAQLRYDTFVPARISPEDIPDNDNGFLDDIRHLRIDEVE